MRTPTRTSGTTYTQNYRANIQIDITPGGGAGEIVEVTIGDPASTSSSSYLPTYSLYEYSLTQQIYTADEIGVGGTVNSLTMWLKNTSSYARNFNIYMKEVSESAFASGSAWVSMSDSDMVGSYTLANGISDFTETTVNLSAPFNYTGNGNLVICVQDVTGSWSSGAYANTMAANGNQALYAYRDGSAYNPSAPGVTGSTLAQKNVVRLTFVSEGGDTPEVEPGLHTLAYYDGAGAIEDQEELIDVLHIVRPNGAWMEPYHFNLYNDGDASVEVLVIDFLHNNGYFTMESEVPFTVANNGRPGVDLYINTNDEWNDTEAINSLLAVNTNERSTHLYEIIAEPYQPYCPDVVEKAYDLGNLTQGTEWREYMSTLWDGPQGQFELHPNYDMPDFEENIPDGYDAVMKFTVDRAMSLNARVVEGYENGKVALYAADFGGQPGPMADNNYTERPMNGGLPPTSPTIPCGTIHWLKTSSSLLSCKALA